MESIRIQNVRKVFDGQVVALDGIDLEVNSGELFFLLGGSGCGKTTLLRCIAGLEIPTTGKIYFGQSDVTALAPHKREAAMVFQSYALWPHLSVEKNISFGLEERKIPRSEINYRVAEALEMVRLSGYGSRSIDQMSGGQQQRVSLARALVVKPRCLLLDEPLSNLDAQLRIEMRREIRRIVKENGLTGIYVTHDQEEALAMADRMAVLSEGKIAQVGTPEEIYSHPQTAYVAGFIGETNLLPACVTAGKSGFISVQIGDRNWSSLLFEKRWIPQNGDEVLVSIRPEAWRINEINPINVVNAKMVNRTYLGQRVEYIFESSIGKLHVVEINPRKIYNINDEVTLSAEMADLVILPKV